MNIAFLSSASLSNPKESARITTLNLAKSLSQKGHQVFIITEKVPNLPDQEAIEGIPVFRYYKSPGKILSYPLAVRKIQKEKKIMFDILHGFSATPLFLPAMIISKIFAPKAKTIYTLKSYSRNKWGRRGSFLLRFINQVTFPTKEHALKYGKFKRNEVIIHSPVDTKKFCPKDKEELKRKKRLEGNKILFYYGAMWENKGIDLLISSLPEIIKKQNKLILLCAPRYKHFEKQVQLVDKLNLKLRVTFLTGNLPIEDYVALADLVVLPYPNLIGTEGNPSCLLEAMACKTPVVTTDLPELREIAGGLVWMAKPGDARSLAETINYALAHPSAEMVEKAYLKAQEFRVEKITEEFLEVYRGL